MIRTVLYSLFLCPWRNSDVGHVTIKPLLRVYVSCDSCHVLSSIVLKVNLYSFPVLIVDSTPYSSPLWSHRNIFRITSSTLVSVWIFLSILSLFLSLPSFEKSTPSLSSTGVLGPRSLWHIINLRTIFDRWTTYFPIPLPTPPRTPSLSPEHE